jgi:hypothetical protein
MKNFEKWLSNLENALFAFQPQMPNQRLETLPYNCFLPNGHLKLGGAAGPTWSVQAKR